MLVVVDKHLGQILSSTQDKADFIGSETNMSLSCSRACKKCGDYLQPLVKVISTVLVRMSFKCCIVNVAKANVVSCLVGREPRSFPDRSLFTV